MMPNPHILLEVSLTVVVTLVMLRMGLRRQPARRPLDQPPLRVLPPPHRDAVLPALHALTADRQECRRPLSS